MNNPRTVPSTLLTNPVSETEMPPAASATVGDEADVPPVVPVEATPGTTVVSITVDCGISEVMDPET